MAESKQRVPSSQTLGRSEQDRSAGKLSADGSSLNGELPAPSPSRTASPGPKRDLPTNRLGTHLYNMLGNWPQVLIGLASLVAAVVAPVMLNSSTRTIYIFLMLSVMVVCGLSLLMGFAGQVSLGQGAFYAVGAYTAAIMAVHGLPTLLGLLMAPLVTMVVAVIIGSPLLRLRGHYLAFATLAFQLIVIGLMSNLRSLTGGAPGITNIPTLRIAGLRIVSGTQYSYLALIGTVIVLVITRNLVRSRPGRALRALATNEQAATAVGVPVGRYRLSVFVLAAGFAGLAGGIYAFYLSYISPTSFPLLLSIEFLIMAVIGGLGTVAGAVVGAAVITTLVQILTSLGQAPGLPTYLPTVFSDAVYALVLILVLVFLPAGLVPNFQKLLSKLPGVRRRS
jgi:branched-chain amino acid transport system permease protein